MAGSTAVARRVESSLQGDHAAGVHHRAGRQPQAPRECGAPAPRNHRIAIAARSRHWALRADHEDRRRRRDHPQGRGAALNKGGVSRSPLRARDAGTTVQLPQVCWEKTMNKTFTAAIGAVALSFAVAAAGADKAPAKSKASLKDTL